MMAAGVRTVKIRFDGEAKGLAKASKDGERAVSSWTNKVKGFGLAAAAAGAVAGKALFDFARSSVDAFTEAQAAQTQLADAFARFPKLADTNIGRLQDLNSALALKTKFDDDAFASGQAVLAQFKLSGKQLTALTPLLADYAAKTGQDLPTAAETLGKSFLGNTKALKSLGINYKSTGDRAKDIANITALLRKQVGGFAEKQGKTAAGQAAILSNQFGELKETVGAKLLPVLMSLAKWGLIVIDWISKNTDILGPLAAVIATVVAIQWAWNVAMSANPIGLVIIAVAALVAAIVWVATKTTFFQTLWKNVWGGIKAAAAAVGSWFKDTLWGKWLRPPMQAIHDKMSQVWDYIKSIPGRIGSAFKSLGETLLAPFKWAFHKIAELWNNTVGRIHFSIPGWVPGVGGKSFAFPTIEARRRGGPVRAGRDYLVGENGPEILRMGSRAGTVIPGAGGDIYVSVWIGDTELRSIVRAEVRDTDRDLKRGVLAGAGAR
jgi:hypothetical protein